MSRTKQIHRMKHYVLTEFNFTSNLLLNLNSLEQSVINKARLEVQPKDTSKQNQLY